MFRKFPYPGWLILFGLCLGFCLFRFHTETERLTPSAMAAEVNDDIASRLKEVDAFVKDTTTIERFFKRSYTEQSLAASQQYHFYVYAFTDSTPSFWNTNTVIARHNDTLAGKTVLRYNTKGVFIRRSLLLDAHRELIIFIPIFIKYPIANNYLTSHFAASPNIPPSTQIMNHPNGGKYVFPIILPPTGTVGYLSFEPSDIKNWVPDLLFTLVFLGCVFSFLTALQLLITHLLKGRLARYSGVAIAGCAIVIRAAIYLLGYPFHFGELPFFSPALYASSKFLTSLGDLFIYLFLFIWSIAYIFRHTQYRALLGRERIGPASKIAGFALIFPFTYFIFFVTGIIRGLIIDSSISFDVNHFYAINLYTFLGILAIIAMVAITAVSTFLFNLRLKALTGSLFAKYLLLIAGLAVYAMFTYSSQLQYATMVSSTILLFFVLLDVPFLGISAKVNQPQMMVWALLICVLTTGIIHFYNEQKEKTSRLAFVEQKLAPQRDNLIEFSFDPKAKAIELDKQVKAFFYKPTANSRKTLDQYLENQYFSGYTGRYQVNTYLFNENHIPVFNKDTISFETLNGIKTESAITNSAYLYYKESVLDRHFYLSYIPIYNDTINNIVGYVLLDFNLKRNTAETVYPELLAPQDHQATAGEHEYAYAIYTNSKLITQTNDYPFPVSLKYDTLKPQNYEYTKKGGIQTLIYKVGDKRTVVVVHYHSEVIETVTLFSYVFGLEVLIALIMILYRLYLGYSAGGFTRKKYFRLTLRRRVHLSMLIVVFVSFTIIGYVTILYFSNEYRATNDAKLQSALYTAKQNVQDYLAAENAYGGADAFNGVTHSSTFKKFINTLSNTQKTDINIYNNEGDLVATSQEEIFDKGVIAGKMNPTAFYHLFLEGNSLVIQGEKAGKLQYTSAYQPLRDEKGTSLGYVNVPFFSSDKDLDFQISNIVVTLINLYAFIFLISSLITVLMTRWMTRTFDIIIRQFDKINLENNERIDWPYEDEVGKLVAEYNKMVQKVEQNAARLAQSERESAWREMARQVAHEIKNPLTPMKLNIQYLQQAAKNGHPDIQGLTARVSASIIEQIDNLSYIASEFSNFAKLPEARPEDLDVGDIIAKAAELYTKSPDLSLTIVELDHNLTVTVDKSQMLRVITNLLENARQAIPDGREGKITVTIRQQHQQAEIAIQDNGTGIDEEVAERIFQPYFTTKTSGTGLGLAMTQKIIEFWKGKIWFLTELGTGTTFYITLPLK